MIDTSKNSDTTNTDDTLVMLDKNCDSIQETMKLLSNSYLMEKIRKGDEQFQNAFFRTCEPIDVDDND